MTFHRFFILLALFLPSLVSAQDNKDFDPALSWELTEAKWEPHVSVPGRFSVLAPGPFQEKADTITTAVGDLVYYIYFLQVPSEKAENEVYMVSYVDYPPGTFPADSTQLIEEFFAATMESAAASVRGEVMFSNEVYVQDFPGRYWRIDYLNGRAGIRTRAFLVGDRYYSVQTVSQRKYGLNYSTDRFLESFRPIVPATKEKKQKRKN